MIIRVEPKDFFMTTTLLIFPHGQPHPEDDEVKRYLADHALEPKRTFETALQELNCTVWQFGGCYLGRHLDAIADIQKKHLEAEMLGEEISRLLSDGADVEVREAVATLPVGKLQALVGMLVEEFRLESSFGSDAEGNIKVTLEPAAVQRRFKELLMAS